MSGQDVKVVGEDEAFAPFTERIVGFVERILEEQGTSPVVTPDSVSPEIRFSFGGRRNLYVVDRLGSEGCIGLRYESRGETLMEIPVHVGGQDLAEVEETFRNHLSKIKHLGGKSDKVEHEQEVDEIERENSAGAYDSVPGDTARKFRGDALIRAEEAGAEEVVEDEDRSDDEDTNKLKSILDRREEDSEEA